MKSQYKPENVYNRAFDHKYQKWIIKKLRLMRYLKNKDWLNICKKYIILDRGRMVEHNWEI